jgi:YggT family protein
MFVIEALFVLISYAITAAIIVIIGLMIVRLVLNYADVNPFNRIVMWLRNITEPIVAPVRRALIAFGMGPNIAPLVTILIAILAGWFALQLAEAVLNTFAGVIFSLDRGAPIALIGYVIYGLLALYTILLFIRIIFSWGMVSYSNPLMRFLVNITEPLLLPLRRVVPPLGMFDISPLIAFFILWLFQAAVAGTLLRGWPLRFIG